MRACSRKFVLTVFCSLLCNGLCAPILEKQHIKKSTLLLLLYYFHRCLPGLQLWARCAGVWPEPWAEDPPSPTTCGQTGATSGHTTTTCQETDAQKVSFAEECLDQRYSTPRYHSTHPNMKAVWIRDILYQDSAVHTQTLRQFGSEIFYTKIVQSTPKPLGRHGGLLCVITSPMANCKDKSVTVFC